MQIVLGRLEEYSSKQHFGKCKFYRDKIDDLEHMIYPGGLCVMTGKVEVIMPMPRLHDVSWLRALLGFCN